jgi:two-component system OmpR family response regulator/two-component system phosphate regulon response regulator OmpR
MRGYGHGTEFQAEPALRMAQVVEPIRNHSDGGTVFYRLEGKLVYNHYLFLRPETYFSFDHLITSMTNTDFEQRPRRLLIVDDDTRVRELLQRYLSEQGYEVRSASNAEQLNQIMSREVFDLLILDLMLPGEDGLSICRRLRAQGNEIAIIMLTARGEDVDRIVGLEMGADDYLPKPFNPRELLARIQALMRRPRLQENIGGTEPHGKVHFGGMTVDFNTRTLIRPGQQDYRLTTGEFSLLCVLLTHPRKPISRDHLMALSRNRERGPFDRAIDVQISRLRKLLEVNVRQPRYIQTVWGMGYMFVPDEEDRDA